MERSEAFVDGLQTYNNFVMKTMGSESHDILIRRSLLRHWISQSMPN